MEVWKISCYSECGSYFAQYLQSVTVIAAGREEAIEEVQKWLKEEGRSFIRSDQKTWNIELLTNHIAEGVIDWHADSDY